MSQEPRINFDTSLATFARLVSDCLGSAALDDGVFVRDATGRLSFVAAHESPTDESERDRIRKKMIATMGAYSRTDRVLSFQGDPGARRLLNEKAKVPIEVEGVYCHLIDRRIVGTGWLDEPNEQLHVPPRVVFASIKGGVGRSTALAIAASDLARRGRNVLVVDLDLEAPGLGDFLLTKERLPDFGTIDYLVENGIGGVLEKDLGQFVGISVLTTSGGGRVDVVPALGQYSAMHPVNVLPKLARAMIEDVTEGAEPVRLATQMSTMIDRLISRSEYDVVLIDSRAGLAEIAAPVILGLGATILLFGTAQQQTIDGYRALFASLRVLAQRDREFQKAAAWRFLLKAVYAKASHDPRILARHRDDLYDLFAEYIYDAEVDSNVAQADFTFARDDVSAPHWPLMIPFNPSFIDFDSARNRDQLSEVFYEQTFRPFMSDLDKLIDDAKEAAELDADAVE